MNHHEMNKDVNTNIKTDGIDQIKMACLTKQKNGRGSAHSRGQSNNQIKMGCQTWIPDVLLTNKMAEVLRNLEPSSDPPYFLEFQRSLLAN